LAKWTGKGETVVIFCIKGVSESIVCGSELMPRLDGNWGRFIGSHTEKTRSGMVSVVIV
jgi:hypothetical protein